MKNIHLYNFSNGDKYVSNLKRMEKNAIISFYNLLLQRSIRENGWEILGVALEQLIGHNYLVSLWIFCIKYNSFLLRSFKLEHWLPDNLNR